MSILFTDQYGKETLQLQMSGGIVEKILEDQIGDNEILAFIERISPTLMGIKPAYLINTRKRILDFSIDYFYRDSGIAFSVIKHSETRVQLFIFHPESLKKTLSDAKINAYLNRMGYPVEATLQAMVDWMINKIRSNAFPHEVGLFLGYPLKDVCGFMGMPIPYRKTMGWKMYGDLRPSERVYFAYKHAQKQMRTMIEKARC